MLSTLWTQPIERKVRHGEMRFWGKPFTERAAFHVLTTLADQKANGIFKDNLEQYRCTTESPGRGHCIVPKRPELRPMIPVVPVDSQRGRGGGESHSDGVCFYQTRSVAIYFLPVVRGGLGACSQVMVRRS